MNFGFYIIMAAQFFSSLADNALLVAAIALLMQYSSPSWVTPYLKFFFVVSYVLLAPWVGAFADRLPKGQVMLVANTVKIAGCLVMLFDGNPLAAYALVGLGAAAYSPAKYGILTEYLPPSQLVIANGWIEGLTVGSIILGTVLGGVLITAPVGGVVLAFDIPGFDIPGMQHYLQTPADAAVLVIAFVYAIAAWFNLYIPRTDAPLKPLPANPLDTVRDFAQCCKRLWTDKLGQVSLAVTTLFWGAGATLQFIVIEWARAALDYNLSKASILQGVVALGIAIGALTASARITLDRSVKVIPMGIGMGIFVISMVFVRDVRVAMPMMIVIGGLAGFFVVPMNALLQHRGHNLMGAGRSIAVQNFNENISILVMIAGYSALLALGLSIYVVIILYGLFVAGTMTLVLVWYRRNRHKHRSEIEALLEIARSERH